MKNTGRFFEKLISLLEQGLAATDTDFKIERNKKILDVDGNEREIDVYIETDIHGVHKLTMAIECKDHVSKVKLSDIDAFDAKTNRLGISKRVYVSKSGYQKGVLDAAKKRGIELCTLSDVGDKSTIVKWLAIPGLVLYNNIFNFKHTRLLLDNLTEVPKIEGEMEIYKEDRTRVSISELQQSLVNSISQNVENEKLKPGTRDLSIVLNFPNSDAFYLKVGEYFYKIGHVLVVVDIVQEEKVFPISSVSEYASVENKEKLGEIAAIEFPALNKKNIISFVKSEKTGLTKVIIISEDNK